mgnify:CR=1 FL=1
MRRQPAEETVCDLTQVYDTTFELTCQKNNGKPPFGISKAHWEKTRDLKITGFLEDCAPLCAEYIIRLGGGK